MRNIEIAPGVVITEERSEQDGLYRYYVDGKRYFTVTRPINLETLKRLYRVGYFEVAVV